VVSKVGYAIVRTESSPVCSGSLDTNASSAPVRAMFTERALLDQICGAKGDECRVTVEFDPTR
jgi:hypothetical protein